MRGKESRSVSFDPKEFRQFDHGYAVTSHSSQGLTADRVIAPFDTDSSRSLINSRLAYVAISRASEDAHIYTNNAETLGRRLATDVTKTAALDSTTRISPGSPNKETVGSPASYVKEWFRDYKAAITPGETIEPKPLSGNIVNKPLTLAMDSDPARIKRVLNLLPESDAGTQLPTGRQGSAGRVQLHEYNNPDSRHAAMAADYAARPEKSVMLVPNRAERDELTRRARADLYAQGKLGRKAYAITVLVEKTLESKMRVESYAPGDKIQYRKGSHLDGIPYGSRATVISVKPKGNLLTVQFDATREKVTYSPSQFRTQTCASRLYREEIREIAEGERIRFTSYDGELGVRSGDLGTVTRMGQDRSLTVQLDCGKTLELSPEKARRIDYGYAVDGLQRVRADRILVTGGSSPSSPIDSDGASLEERSCPPIPTALPLP